MKRNQKGFGAIEGLLFIIIVLLIGFIGYYVYHTRNNTNSTYNTAANTSNTSAKNSTTGETNSLTFTNLGVKITLNDKIKAMTYSPNPQYPDTSDNVSTQGYKSSAKSCDSSDPGNFGIITKQNGTYDPDSDMLILLKQFNGYWISYTPALGNPCEGKAGAEQLAAVKDDLKTALTHAFQTATQVQ